MSIRRNRALIALLMLSATAFSKDATITRLSEMAVAVRSSTVEISGDGQVAVYVAEQPIIDTQGKRGVGVVVYDLVTEKQTLVATSISGGVAINEDGQFVAYVESGQVFVLNRDSGERTHIGADLDGDGFENRNFDPSLSADGRLVAFNRGRFFRAGVYLHDTTTSETIRIDVSADGSPGDSFARPPTVSANGQYVLFRSSDLVPDDPPGGVFLYEIETAQLRRLGTGESPAISGDGRFVAYSWRGHLFVEDLQSGEVTQIVSSDVENQPELTQPGRACCFAREPSLSFDGRFVAFTSNYTDLVDDDSNLLVDIFVHDRVLSETKRVSLRPNGSEIDRRRRFGPTTETGQPKISGDGSVIVYVSNADNIVPESGPVVSRRISAAYVYDNEEQSTRRLSETRDRSYGFPSTLPAISANARHVIFTRDGDGDTNTDVANAAVLSLDKATRTMTLASADDSTTFGALADSRYGDISRDGGFVTFTSNAKELLPYITSEYLYEFRTAPPFPEIASHAYVRDTRSHRNFLASVPIDGTLQANNASQCPVLSDDGNVVAFLSLASNLVENDANDNWDVFVRDLEQERTTRVSVGFDGGDGLGRSECPAISADGRFVSFASWAANLVRGDANGTRDVFVYEIETATIKLVRRNGQGSNGVSGSPSISGDGRYTAYWSQATNLVDLDTNDKHDVFVYDRIRHETSRVSVSGSGGEANNWSTDPSISDDGRFVAFVSTATNIALNATDGASGIYLHDRTTRRTTLASPSHADGPSFEPRIDAGGDFIVFGIRCR